MGRRGFAGLDAFRDVHVHQLAAEARRRPELRERRPRAAAQSRLLAKLTPRALVGRLARVERSCWELEQLRARGLAQLPDEGHIVIPVDRHDRDGAGMLDDLPLVLAPALDDDVEKLSVVDRARLVRLHRRILTRMRSPAPPYRGEGPHALWHVSEDATITRFEPHRAVTATRDAPFVWAIDTRHLPLYWFPRDCPRGTWWADEATTAEDEERLLAGTPRVHAVQGDWLDSVRSAHVVAYRLPEESFVQDDEVGGYWVSREPVEPLEVVELGDLLELHASAGIELRVVPDLWALWQRVIASTVQFSGMRLRNLGARE
jgi:hypothetical protein